MIYYLKTKASSNPLRPRLKGNNKKRSDDMDKKIKGVIVSEYPFEDNSKIINIFTENGLLGVIAKGAKKVRSPFFSTTTKFNYGSFNINYKENGLSKLIDADTINSYNNIKKDIVKISYVTYITELVTKVYKHDGNKNIYKLYLDCLDKINDNYNPEAITIILRLKLLDYLGIMPIIDRCVVCGNTHDIVTMSSYLGGYVCKNCLRNEKVISTKSIKLIRMLYLVDISKLNKLDISKDVLKELEEFTEDYYDRYSGIYLNYGVTSILFALSLFFSLIVIYDSMGIRYESGNQARVINKVVGTNLKEKLGHNPLEVLAGVVLGITLGIVMNIIFT